MLEAKEAQSTEVEMTDAQNDLHNGAAEPATRSRRRTLRDVEAEHGGPGVFSYDYRNHFKCVYAMCTLAVCGCRYSYEPCRLRSVWCRLDHDDQKFDIVPEILDGKNIADFVHPDIEQRLLELEREEDEFVENEANTVQDMDADSDLDDDMRQQAAEIRKLKVRQQRSPVGCGGRFRLLNSRALRSGRHTPRSRGSQEQQSTGVTAYSSSHQRRRHGSALERTGCERREGPLAIQETVR